MKLWKGLFRVVSVVVVSSFILTNAGFVLADNLRTEQPGRTGAQQEITEAILAGNHKSKIPKSTGPADVDIASGGSVINNSPVLNFAKSAAGIIYISNAEPLLTIDTEERDGQLIDKLVYDATFNPDQEIVQYCRSVIKKLAASRGIAPASVYNLYVAKAKDPTRYTVPAINIRGMTYDTARAIFRAAKKQNVGPIIFEIAKSEIKYTGQRPAEYANTILAAAIKEGYTGPIFLQGDHFQIAKKDYDADPAKAVADAKKLIKEAIEAGFYQIDLDTSTLVDPTKPTTDEQQKLNYTLAAELTAYIRSIEPAGVTVSVGGEIGEIGVAGNSTEEELRAYLTGYNATLGELGRQQGRELAGLTKIAIQTGTKHGGIRGADGKPLAKVKVDFNTIAKLGKIAREEFGLAGVVQHGASTLPTDFFSAFAGNVPAGFEMDAELLNEEGTAVLATNPAAEVHLATAYQDTVYDHPEFPATLRETIRQYIAERFPAKEGQTADKAFTENRKNGWGPFKAAVWNLPETVKEPIRQSLEEQFSVVFTNLGVNNTRALIDDIGGRTTLFASGYEPTDEIRSMPNPDVEIAALVNALLVQEGWRGKATGLKDKKDIKKISDAADARSNQLWKFLLTRMNRQTRFVASEGKERDQVAESFEGGEVINPGAADKIDMAIDVIEGSTRYATNNGGKTLRELEDSESGGTNPLAFGPNLIESLGKFSDIYADTIFTLVPPQRRAEFNNLDPSLESYEDIKAVLSRIAEANGIGIGNMEVVLMKREREGTRLTSLKKIQEENSGLEITIIGDGTVAHGLLANLGRKEGKHKVMWTVGAAPEGSINLCFAKALENDGAVAALRIYSKQVNDSPEGAGKAKDLSWRFNFSEEEKTRLRRLRPNDAEAIIAGKKIFTTADIKGPVEGVVIFNTDNGVFKQTGIKEIEPDKFEVGMLRIKEVEGKPYVWMDKQVIDIDPDRALARVKEAEKKVAVALSVTGMENKTWAGLLKLLNISKSGEEIEKEREGLIFSSQAVAELGLTLPSLANNLWDNKTKIVAVVDENDKATRSIIKAFNEEIGRPEAKIEVFESADEAAKYLISERWHEGKVTFVGTKDEIAGLPESVRNVVKGNTVAISAILEALGKVEPIRNALDDFRKARQVIEINV